MSLTVARSERVRGVLTHASRMEIMLYNFHGARVSNTPFIINKLTQNVNIKCTRAALIFAKTLYKPTEKEAKGP